MNQKTQIIVIVIYLIIPLCNAQESSFSSTVKGKSDSIPLGYVPPLISNGSLSMLIDYQGGQGQQEFAQMVPCIYWAGRRYDPTNNQHELIPFGHFEHELSIDGEIHKSPVSWAQTLDTKNAMVICHNDYGNDLNIETTVFTHLDYDLIVVNKKIRAISPSIDSAEIAFNYYFTPPGYQNHPPRRTINNCSIDEKNSTVKFQYEIDGYQFYKGAIFLFSDKPFISTVNNQVASLSSNLNFKNNNFFEITYYILFTDSMDGADYQERAEKLQSNIRKSGWIGLSDSHISGWQNYINECFVNIPEKQMELVYNTAQYHMRANATKWSFPVGIFPTHWHGRYFGWDEMFIFQALVSSGHLSISKRCPEFRFSVLSKATQQVSHYNKPGKFGAKFMWETLEDGTEGAPPGFWNDHVFHMSNIASSAWNQFLYTDDREYLKTTGYPVIRECARFFMTHMVYENSNGNMFIGKCTDLERLGPAVQNPFMTACGVIYNLEVAAQAARLLSENSDEVIAWEYTAKKLRENLPQENNMYVPFLGFKEKSIASLGGLFPYPIFDKDNILQRNAARDFVINAQTFGNMYPSGASICPWYAGWIASALALLGDKEEPSKFLYDTSKSAGYFGELWEINEPGININPWFSTASGNYIYALNQMLIQCKKETIWIAPAVPKHWEDYSFKLACHGNISATIHVNEGKIKELSFSSSDPLLETYRTLIIPKSLIEIEKINKKVILSINTDDDNYHFGIKINNATSLYM